MSTPHTADATTTARHAHPPCRWSILFGYQPQPIGLFQVGEPAYFRDLNLDRVETDVFGAEDEYELTPHFRQPLVDQSLIHLRQAVFVDLDRAEVRGAVNGFVRRMSIVRERLNTARGASEPYEGRRWHLEAAVQYCEAILTLQTELAEAEPASPGLQGVVAHLNAYHDSPAFRALRHDRSAAVGALASVHYAIWVEGARVTVGSYDGEPDYSEDVEQTFARFRAVDVDSTQLSVPRGSGPLDHVEASVLACTAKIFPAHFEVLDRFCRDHDDFLDPVMVLFDREIHFYLSYIDYLTPLRENSLPVTTPVLTQDAVSESLVDVYDLPLAVQCVAQNRQVVVNAVTLDEPERILVISGPNNGGKTTLARHDRPGAPPGPHRMPRPRTGGPHPGLRRDLHPLRAPGGPDDAGGPSAE